MLTEVACKANFVVYFAVNFVCMNDVPVHQTNITYVSDVGPLGGCEEGRWDGC